MSYHFSKTVDLPFDAAVAATTAALKTTVSACSPRST